MPSNRYALTDLDVVFITPLRREIGLRPAFEAVHEGYVVAHIASSKVFVCVVSKDLRYKYR